MKRVRTNPRATFAVKSKYASKNTLMLKIRPFLVFLAIIFARNATSHGETTPLDNGDRAVAACPKTGLDYLKNGQYYVGEIDAENCQREMSTWLDEINEKAMEFNIQGADFAWSVSVEPEKAGKGTSLDKSRSQWRRQLCGTAARLGLGLLAGAQRRQLRHLCRGAATEPREAEILSAVLDEMQTLYTTSKVCVPMVNTSRVELNHERAVMAYLKKVRQIFTEYDIPCQNNLQNCNSYAQIHNGEIFYTGSKPRPQGSDHPVVLAAKLAAAGAGGAPGPCLCLSGEPQLERLMAQSGDEQLLKWAWLAWREKTGPPIRPLYEKMVEVKNSAARRAGYSDLGEVWREELEIPELESVVEELLQQTSELYRALHGVVRFFLRRHYGARVVSERGPIPAHVLGNLWAQSWERALPLILPRAKQADLDYLIKKTNWRPKDMVKKAEDFYTSIGLFPMTEKFWKYSYFGHDAGLHSSEISNSGQEQRREAKCHGTAANMFQPGDFRMIYCVGRSFEDFYVIHHEMGHIEYYMSYDPQLPTLFQDGANSAFQESVGDAIMLGVVAPQHLQRLGLIQDNMLYRYSNETSGQSHTEQGDANHDGKYLQDLEKKPKPYSQGDRYGNSIDYKNKMANYGKYEADKTLFSSLVRESDTSKVVNEVNLRRNPQGLNPGTSHFDSGFSNYEFKQNKEVNGETDSTENLNIFVKEDDHITGKDFDSILLLRQALTKLPQIPFGYIMDRYRWDIFSGKVKAEEYNRVFWDYVTKYQGVEPPDGQERSEFYFDAAAKFHVPDNTPYVRYFLSSFLQMQMFRGLCQWSVLGRASPDLHVPMPLHRCDIYGSKKAGKKLREMMSKGSSVHWSQALFLLTGDNAISSEALHLYFAPLKSILDNLIMKYNIPLGW